LVYFLEQFEALLTARPDPPYVLVIIGLLIAIACAIPLIVLVRQRIKYWAKNNSANALPVRGSIQILLPFSGTMTGMYIFTAAGLEVFGVPVLLIKMIYFSMFVTDTPLFFPFCGHGCFHHRSATYKHPVIGHI